MTDIFPTYILNKTTEKIAKEKSEWIDSTIASWIPAWRLAICKRFNSKLLTKILIGEIEIINEDLIADFGIRTWIKWNGKVIGVMKFKL